MTAILAFDTATDGCSAALLYDGHLIQRFQLAPRQHAELLLGMIDELLAEAGLKLAALNAIAFGSGPGSFMGVRIAASVAQGLAYGVQCSVIPVSTLQVLAQVAYQENGAACVLAGWDARMDEMYWGAYRLGELGIMEAVVPDILVKPAAIDTQIMSQHRWVMIGNAWQVYRHALAAALQYADQELVDLYPQAGALALIAMQCFNRGQVLPPMAAEPIYLRNQVAKKMVKTSNLE